MGAGVLIGGGLFLKELSFSLGVLLALPVSFLFQYWLERAVERTGHLSPGRAYYTFLARALARMSVSFFLLVLAAVKGPAFLLGVLGGLILPMLAYLAEAVTLFVPALKKSRL
ncbi:hypothetical protein SAMN00808754_3279 [Thermanaeromonas toyohensis ToBE]|uniref:ATP synthase I chain n=2 Tax=Thermanaeromonas TaxID=202949 RepID=A0A1W1W380_9FIRM|nr:hypothetical protein SAMN00808754_3279 [Thermanaeromonas toyohensis ToBE]